MPSGVKPPLETPPEVDPSGTRSGCMQITGLSQLETGNAVSIAVAKKAMQADKAQAQAMLDMLKDATEANSARSASPDGVGQQIDVMG